MDEQQVDEQTTTKRRRASTRSEVPTFTESESIPVPTSLTVYAVTSQTVLLQCNQPDGVDSVHIERSTDGESWGEFEEMTSRSAIDRACEPDTLYKYRAFAAVGGERSAYSDVVEARTAA